MSNSKILGKLPENTAADVKYKIGPIRADRGLQWSEGNERFEDLRSASLRGHALEREGASDITIWTDVAPWMTLAELDANLAV
jgi:hypothetical protein